MYSYEDRVRAVELYIKLGKRVRATIRQLGYPTKNALKGWHREYERRLDLPKGYTRPKPKYSEEQKAAAVRHYLDHGRCIAATMKALGYPGRASLSAWIQELDPDSRVRVVGTTDRTPRPPALKQAAVVALCTRQGSAHALAQEFAVCKPTLYNWKNQLLWRKVRATS
jgi:transposase-like protein